jgi:hypothetical protein
VEAARPEALAAAVGVSGPTVRRALKGGVCTPLVARALAELVATREGDQ